MNETTEVADSGWKGGAPRPRMSKSAVIALQPGPGLPCTLPVGSQMQKEVMMRWAGRGRREPPCVMGSRGAQLAAPLVLGEQEGQRTRSSGNRLETNPTRECGAPHRGNVYAGTSVPQSPCGLEAPAVQSPPS